MVQGQPWPRLRSAGALPRCVLASALPILILILAKASAPCAAVAQAAGAAHAQAVKPHIVFVLVDDNGWAGVGYNNPHISTPHLDALAAQGLKLTSQYVYKFCAPTRGSFLTGRYPYKLAATRANFIPWTLPDGTHLGYSMLPKKLKPAGYRSVHVGKWHQGLYTPAYTPVGRGFDASFGFLEGGEDHNTSRTFGDWCRKNEVDLSVGTRGAGGAPFPYTWPACTWTTLRSVALHNFYDPNSTDIARYNPFPAPLATEAACRDLCQNRIDCAGYSWRAAEPTPGNPNYHKCFLVSRDGGHHPASQAFVSALCVRDGAAMRNGTTIAARGSNGTYTGELFAEQAVRTVSEHGDGGAHDGVPLFLYYAMHNTHAPLEAPWSYVEPYARLYPADTRRSTFSGMVTYVDQAVANLTAALKDAGMWSNTLLIWTTDNGSPVSVGGSNHPLRGGKGSNWEGGTRVPAFVAGGFLPASQVGKTSDGMIHIADWHATICDLAGVDPSVGEPGAVSPLDGLSAWPWVSGAQAYSNRVEVVYDHRMFKNASDPSSVCLRVTTDAGEVRCANGALRVNQWKLVVGPEMQNGWFGWFSPNATTPINKTSPAMTDSACPPSNPCLFDLSASITEHQDVAGDVRYKAVLALMLKRFRALANEYHPPLDNPPVDLDGYCAAVALNGGFVGPWMNVTLDQL